MLDLFTMSYDIFRLLSTSETMTDKGKTDDSLREHLTSIEYQDHTSFNNFIMVDVTWTYLPS